MIIFLIVLIIIVIFVENWSIKNSLTGINFDYNPSKILVEPDEKFNIITYVTNRSRRFIPFLYMEELLPDDIEVMEVKENIHRDNFGNKRHLSTVYLMPKQKLIRKINVSFSKRGRYILRGANLSGGDFLGIKEIRQDFFCLKEVVVYPKESHAKDVQKTVGGFLGDISVRRFIMEDPMLISGFKDYTGREPMKSISWAQSAKVNRLMVKQFDFTTDPSVSILLNVECKYNDKECLIEGCFSLTRTVCRIMEERRVKYDFFTNATTSNAISNWSYISEGLGRKHFFTILEGLGRAYYGYTEPFSETVDKSIKKISSKRSTIIITPHKDFNEKDILYANYMDVLIISAEESIK